MGKDNELKIFVSLEGADEVMEKLKEIKTLQEDVEYVSLDDLKKNLIRFLNDHVGSLELYSNEIELLDVILNG